MVINPVLKKLIVNRDENPPKSLSYLISQFLNPIPIARGKQKSEATEPEPNPYLYRKEDDDVGGAVGKEPQFEASIVTERGPWIESDARRERERETAVVE